MLQAKNLPKKLWAEAVNVVAYTLTCTDKGRSNKDSPYKTWHGKQPTLNKFKTFGSKVYVVCACP